MNNNKWCARCDRIYELVILQSTVSAADININWETHVIWTVISLDKQMKQTKKKPTTHNKIRIRALAFETAGSIAEKREREKKKRRNNNYL